MLEMFAQAVRSFKRFAAQIASERSANFRLPVVVFFVVVIVVQASGCCSWLVPPPVRGQICGTVKNFVAFWAPVLHMNDHGTPGKRNVTGRYL